MKKIVILLVFAVMLLSAWPVAASTPHYINGLEGNKTAVMPPEGLYWRMYNFYYSADKLKNNNGKTMDIDYKTRIYVQAHRFIWASDIKFLGARIGADAIVPFVYTDIRVGKNFSGERIPEHFNIDPFTMETHRHSGGLSDILIDPLILSWSGSWYDLSASIGLFIPTGRFHKGAPASPGKGYWTFMPSLGGTVYFDEAKTLSATLMAHYEIHTQQSETRKTMGDHFHFEWGVNKTLMQIFDIGITGYCSWQVTNDKGGRFSSNNKSRTFAIGPELGFYIPNPGLAVNLRALWEFESRNTAQGFAGIFTLTYGF